MAQVIKGPNKERLIIGRTIGEYLFNMGEKHGDKIAQIDAETDESETFASVRLRSIRVAIELQKRGVTSKDIIMFCTRSRLESCIPVLATSYLAAKIASIDPTLSARNINYLIKLVEPAVIFIEDVCLYLLEQSLEGIENRPSIVVIGQTNETSYSKFEDFLKPSQEEKNFKPIIVDSNETALLFFSSGTTGSPKGICLSHLNLFHHVNETVICGRKCDVALVFTTLYWISATIFLLSSYWDGGCRILIRDISVEKVYKFFEKYKVTLSMASPKMAFLLANYPDALKYDTTNLHNIVISGGRISPKVLHELKRALPHTIINCAYAMSETGLITSHDLANPAIIEQKLESSGKACPNVIIKVVDPETNEILSANQQGEIRVKSPGMMVGYHNVDSSQAYDSDGFLKSGDVGYYDDDEYFYIVERLKEMFKYRGFHIVPSVLELVLLEHPAVLESVVFSIPGKEEDGDYPVACVVLKSDYKNIDPKEIEEFVDQRVSEHEKLRGGVHIVENIVKTPTGKPLKNTIRTEFLKTFEK